MLVDELRTSPSAKILLKEERKFTMYEKPMDSEFVRERITALRLERGISEYQTSYALGRSRGYLNNISSGKSLPSMKEFLAICDYFDITPAEFFQEDVKYPLTINEVVSDLKHLSKKELELVKELVRKLAAKKAEG